VSRGIRSVLRNPWLQALGVLLVIFALLSVLYLIRGVLIPFALALIVAYIFDPVVAWLDGRRVGPVRFNRGIAIALLVSVFVTLVLLFVFVAIPNAVLTAKAWIGDKGVDQQQQLNELLELLPAKTRVAVKNFIEAAPKERKEIASSVIGDLVSSGAGVRDQVGRSFRDVALALLDTIVWVFKFVLFFVVAVFLLLDVPKIRKRADEVLPRPYRAEIERVAGAVDLNLKSFFRGQCVVAASLGLIFTVGLGVVGCPFWYIIGPIGGLGAFVPYMPLAAGMVPAVIVSFAHHQDWLHPLLAAAVFGLGLTLDNVYITPKIIGRSVGLHPVFIILSLMIFGTLFGVLGVLFAIPIAAVLKVFVIEAFDRYRRSELYQGRPATQEPSET
jgi:predicted PurR-regulated permease PerM